MRLEPNELLPLDAARDRLADAAERLAADEMPLDEAEGLRAAGDVRARSDLPLRDVSAMDGYALRHVDLVGDVVLPIAFEVAADDSPPPLRKGTVARIFTGAALPSGADTVVPQEAATISGGTRVRLEAAPRGAFVRRGGEVFRRGDLLVAAGEILNPARIALLAAGGIDRVLSVRRPSVAIIVTGDEFVSAPENPKTSGTHDANGPFLAALASEAGLHVARALRVGDDIEAIHRALESTKEDADLVVTSGGVSVGDHDLVPRAVRAAGGSEILHRVAMRPGKPILVARLGSAWVVGLPGNPVSVLVGWHLFARPLARVLAGDAAALRARPTEGSLTGPVRGDGVRTLLVPTTLQRETSPPGLTPLPWKGSHDLLAASRADALTRVDPGVNLAEGSLAPFYPLYS